MTISKDLFLAILSIDSYNRGYETGEVAAPVPHHACAPRVDAMRLAV